MELSFVTLDVFTTTRYRGNPLAVVTIPAAAAASPPTQEQKQAIAREFNYSETVFVHEPAEPAGDDLETRRRHASQRVIDIFTPDEELPFAGHPTIGTAVSLLAHGVDTLVTKAGPIALVQTSPGHIQAAIPHNVHLHAKKLGDMTSMSEGQLSNIQEIRDIEITAPLFSIVNGMTFALTSLPSLDVLAKAHIPFKTQFPVEQLLDAGWRDSFVGKYYYVHLGKRVEDGVTVFSIRSRMLDFVEDPATGSAACALSSYLTLQQPNLQGQTFRYEIEQGVEMGRASNIVVDVAATGSQIDTVKLSGTATQVMSGRLTI